MPRALGGATAPFGLKLLLTRCWLFAGSPLFGKGPVDGMRREAAELRGRIGDGRGGGGIRDVRFFCAGASVPFGERGAGDARW